MVYYVSKISFLRNWGLKISGQVILVIFRNFDSKMDQNFG